MTYPTFLSNLMRNNASTLGASSPCESTFVALDWVEADMVADAIEGLAAARRVMQRLPGRFAKGRGIAPAVSSTSIHLPCQPSINAYSMRCNMI